MTNNCALHALKFFNGTSWCIPCGKWVVAPKPMFLYHYNTMHEHCDNCHCCLWEEDEVLPVFPYGPYKHAYEWDCLDAN